MGGVLAANQSMPIYSLRVTGASPGAAARAVQPSAGVTSLQQLLVRYRHLVRVAWLLSLLLLAACQPDSNGGGGY